MPVPKRGFTEKEAALYLGVSARSLRELRARDQQHALCGEPLEGPAWRRLNGVRIRYYVEDLDAFLDRAPRFGVCESKRTSTSGSEAMRRAGLKVATP